MIDRITLEFAGTRATYLIETPARQWADQLAHQLGALVAWVENYHDMRHDNNVAGTILEARGLLATLDQSIPTPEQNHREHVQAAAMHRLIRRIMMAYAVCGDVPDALTAQAWALLDHLEAPDSLART
jgi:hypothetical protein